MKGACRRVGGRVHSGKRETPEGKIPMTHIKREKVGACARHLAGLTIQKMNLNSELKCGATHLSEKISIGQVICLGCTHISSH